MADGSEQEKPYRVSITTHKMSMTWEMFEDEEKAMAYFVVNVQVPQARTVTLTDTRKDRVTLICERFVDPDIEEARRVEG